MPKKSRRAVQLEALHTANKKNLKKNIKTGKFETSREWDADALLIEQIEEGDDDDVLFVENDENWEVVGEDCDVPGRENDEDVLALFTDENVIHHQNAFLKWNEKDKQKFILRGGYSTEK